MSRHSSTVDLILEDKIKIQIGEREVVLTCSAFEGSSDKLPVKEIYVSKITGNLTIVYDDGE